MAPLQSTLAKGCSTLLYGTAVVPRHSHAVPHTRKFKTIRETLSSPWLSEGKDKENKCATGGQTDSIMKGMKQ